MPGPRAIKPAEKISLIETDPLAHAAVEQAVRSALSGSSAGVRLAIDREFDVNPAGRFPDEVLTAGKSVRDTLDAAGVQFTEPHPWGNDESKALVDHGPRFAGVEAHRQNWHPTVFTEEQEQRKLAHFSESGLAMIRHHLSKHPALVVMMMNVEIAPESFQKELVSIMDEATAKGQRLALISGSSVKTANAAEQTGGLLPELAARLPRVDVGPSPFANAELSAERASLAARLSESRQAQGQEEAAPEQPRSAKPF
jgi:hypothetical protein